MKFKYKIRTKDGTITEGEAEAKDKFDLAHRLKEEGNIVLFTREIQATGGSFVARIEWLINTVKLHEKIVFMRNLSAMIEAGLPLTRALDVLTRQTGNKKLQEILNSIHQKISEGETFSASASNYPSVFSPLAVSMIKAGEESGNLSENLKIIGIDLQKSYLLRKRVKGALMYPSIVIIVMIIIGILMFIYVVPTLTGIFEELNVELPISTKIIIAMSNFLVENTLIALLLSIGAGFLLFLSAQSKHGKRFFETIFLHTPVVGGLIREVNSARTSRTLASLLSSGVKMVDSISITRDVVQNSYYKKVLYDAEKRIQKGTPLSSVFSENKDLYPILVGEMIAVGEETGKLSEMLLRVATFYEGEVEQKTKDMSTIIEPILMVVVGVGVGFFAISMIAPLYSVLQGI